MNITHTKAKWWLMALSIVLGCLSAWAIDQHLNEKTQEIELRTKLDQLTLLVASRDLTRDTTIEASDFVAEMFPVKWAPDDAISEDQSDTLIGKRLVSDIRAGQPLMHMHLQELEPPSLSTLLGPEFKAVSITVDPSSAASGLIRGGDRVDLFVSLDHQGRRLFKGLLQSVQVLGVGYVSLTGHRTDAALTTPEGNITLAVSHTDAVKLVAAREAGTISAVLSSAKSSADARNSRSSTEDLSALLGLPTRPLVRAIPIMYGDRLLSESKNEAETDEPAFQEQDHELDTFIRSVSTR
jgi:pilus assembly protein CpaB